jgi:oligopeptide transport system substrate-binding protein
MHLSCLTSAFLFTVLTVITTSSCEKNEKSNSSPSASTILRLSLPNDPATLDPRQARDLLTLDVIRLMFSGLTRLSSEGKVYPDLAESVERQQDGFSYQVKLKNALWSDNTPVTAHDFVYSWKSSLEKQRACPNAFQLFWIRNARAAYDGKIDVEEIGVRATDDTTLEIDLEMPCPFFEQLLATPAFLAVQKHYDLGKNQYAETTDFPTSGPYMLAEWHPQNNVRLVKNPHFVDHSGGKHTNKPFTSIEFSIVDDATAVTMVEAHKLDWAGSPMGTLPVDNVSMLTAQKKILICPAASTAFLRVNVTNPILSDQRLREALSLIIDRAAIVTHLLQGGQQPAFSLVPPCLLSSPMPQGTVEMKRARDLLRTYCGEKGIPPESLSISLAFKADDRSTKVSMAVQQDIKKTLGINVILHPCDAKQFFAKVSQLDYDLALGSWFADYFDPYSFYSVFQEASNGTNNTGWEDSSYQSLIKKSLDSDNPAVRQQYFSQLEQILARELPVIPLFHGTFNYVKEASIDGITVSPLGYLDIMQR